MIELKNVSKYYHSKDVTNLGLHNISIRFEKNEIVAITGDSGSGKSTLLNVITKIDSFDEGEIYYKGNETSYFSVSDMDDFRKNKIGFIFQNYNILDSYTVLENVMLPLTLKGLSAKEAKVKALELIEKVGLRDRVKARGTKLSGGEKQRCVIARALASDCEILACDEPTGNLDSKTGEEIINLIKEVAKDKLVLIVTHNYEQVKDIVTRKIRVADGEVVEDVKFETMPEDENEDLELEYVPLKKTICARVAKNNTVFTPRKTILLSAILLVICVSILFIFQTISASMGSMIYSSIYENDRSDRYVVYNYDHSPLDTTKLEGLDYDINSWTEDKTEYFDIPSIKYNSVAFYYSDRYSYDITYGNLSKEDNELVLLVPSSYRYLYEDTLNEDLIGKDLIVDNATYKIAGISYTKNVTELVIAGNKKLAKYASFLIFMNAISVKQDENRVTVYSVYDASYKKVTLVLPLEYKNTNIPLDIKAFNIYSIDSIAIEYDAVPSATLYYNENCIEDFLPVFEASVYSKNTLEINKLKKNFAVDECATTTRESKLMLVISNMYSYLLMVLASILLIIVFFITYLIIARVYASKKKDYEILRTLGVTKTDMKHIVNYEVLGIALAVIAFSFILVVILINTVPQLAELRTLKFLTVVIYFVATFLFSYSIARRFNRKLFRFSVTKSMKGDGKHD